MMPIRKGDGTGISAVRLGDGTNISEIRKGDGTVLWSAGADIPDSEVDFSTLGSTLGTQQTGFAGLHFEVSEAFSATIEAEFFEHTVLSQLYLRDVSANSEVTSTSIASSVESLNASLEASKTYALVADDNGSTYDRYQTEDGTNLPTSDNILTVTEGRFDSPSGFTFTTNVYNINRIKVTTN